MKVSVLISVLILAVGAGLGWQGQGQLERAREEHRSVVSQAEALGLSVDGGSSALETRKPLERQRKERELEAEELARDVIAFAKRMEEAQKEGGEQSEEFQKETMEMMKRFLDMDAHQLKALVSLLRESSEISDEMRNGIVGFSIMMLANENPEAALTLFAESSDMLEMDGMGEHVVASALGEMASRDPFAALDWIRENGEKNPKLVTDDTKAMVVAGAARQDPSLAFSLIDELELENQSQAVDGIVGSARTGEERRALLEVVRGQEDGKLKDQVLRELGGQLASEGLSSASKWFEEADLSSEEKSALFEGMHYHNLKEETGAWINWAGDHLEDKSKLKRKTKDMVRQWTSKDYQAVGNWLNETEEGPVKTTAVISYAETLAPYEPETAADWALSLPEGKQRTNLIHQVHRQWKQKDEAAAAAFAAEHGIE